MILNLEGKGITKTLITLLLTVVIISSVLITVFGAEPTRRGVVNDRVSPDPLIIRPAPAAGGSILKKIYAGTEVTVLEDVTGQAVKEGNTLWYRIKYGDTEGYVYSYYITILEDETTSPETTPETTPPGETTPPDETTGGETPPTEPPTIDFEAYLNEQKFPESYKPYLRELHNLYPNWVFKAQHVDYDFEYAVEKELDKSLVHISSISSWKSIEGDAYDWESSSWKGFDGPNWVRASREIIRHYMDPRNFLGTTSVFQFLEQFFDENMQSVDGVKSIIRGTFMENDIADTDGNTLNYATAIYESGRNNGVNPYVLAAMLKQEQGVNGTSGLISGNYSGYIGYFNYFNIGAYSANGMNAIQRGLWYAKGGNNSSTTYGRPWNTRVKSIEGGADYYAKKWVYAGQNTLYLKKFNVLGSSPFTNQYMTNIQGASSEAIHLSQGYTQEMKENAISFLIPVYKNMAETAYPKPTLDGSPNMKLSSLSVSGFELTPGFDTEVLEYMLVVPPAVSSITINAVPMDSTATIAGAGSLPISTGTNVFEIKVTSGNGTVRIYKLTVAKETAENFGELTFTGKYEPKDNIVFGISPGMTVGGFRAEFVSAGIVTVMSATGTPKADGDLIATDDLITVSSTNGIKHADYKASVKGDLNSDGRVNISDLLKIRNRILGSDEFSGVQTYSGDIDGNGGINISDLLKIRNHILGTSTIS